MADVKKGQGPSFFIILIWVVIALIAIQGYRQYVLKDAPAKKKMVTKLKPVAKVPVKPKPAAKVVVVPEKVSSQKKLVPQGKPSQPLGPGKIAIVLDDWGYNRSHCANIAAIDAPLGIAILPGLPYSQDVIACAKAAGKEPMLHLPIEPYRASERYAANYLLTSDMSVSAAKKTLARILKEMAGVVGVNNHTGSKGTESLTLMVSILEDLKKRRLFFVDSFTSGKSVCGEAAARLKMRIARRDVFLDNENTRASIEAEFARAVKIARKTGNVLIIGHDRALTLQIIREQVETLSKEGIDFISVKDYIRRYEYSRN